MPASSRLPLLAWSTLLLVTALLGTLLLHALDREHAANLREARSAADNLLGFSARVLESDLQAGRYADLQVYVDQLARTHPQVSRARVIAANGAILASYGPETVDGSHYSGRAEIHYAYQGRATLELAVDLAGVEQRHRRLALQAGGILGVLALLLALLVHLALRQRTAALRLRARGSELELARESAAIGEARAIELNRTLTVLRRCNEALVRAPSEQSLLEAMCALLVDVGGYRLAWIGYAGQGEERLITLRAAAGHADYLKDIALSWADGPTGNGPSGRAVRTGQVVWIRDTLTDPGYTPWRGLASDFGVRSVIALPLGNTVPATGLLCIYAANPSPYSPEELSLLTELAADISYGIQSQRSQQSLRETTERLQQIAASIREVFWMTDIRDGRLLYVSEAFEAIWQRPRSALYANPLLWREAIHPADRERVEMAGASPEAIGNYDQEYRIVRPDGSLRWIREQASPVRNADGQIYRVAGTAEDITERKEYEARLAHQDRHDLLTGIANRNRLTERLEQLLSEPRAARLPLAVAVLDLDRFRFINDSQGQHAGDAVLRDLAARLHAAVRPGDLVARLAGDQFALLLASEESPDGALQNLRAIQQRVAAGFRLGDTPIAMSCSIGVAFHPEDGTDVSGLLRAAETALQAAKQAGKGRIHAASGELDRHLTERIRLERHLHGALAKHQLALAYQAKVDTHSRRIVGAEALVRWNHPDLGQISPARFIPIAEDTGLILEIGAWVIETASRQLRIWHDSGLPRIPISVNLSAEQFKDGSLPAQIEASLARTGLAPRYLDIEITESVVMGDSEQRMQTISRLKSLGVQISIDDFGTGFSNLNYLKRLQPDRLKIDRGFVANLPGDPIDAAISTAVIALAHSLGMQVVAEGVETAEQLEFLRQHNCNEVQGFLFCRPVEARLFGRMLERVTLEPVSPQST